MGKLSDNYGRRPFFFFNGNGYIYGRVVFSGLARSIFHLIVSRGVQGLGGGMILVVSNASVGDLFAPPVEGTVAGVSPRSFWRVQFIWTFLGVISLTMQTGGGYSGFSFQWDCWPYH